MTTSAVDQGSDASAIASQTVLDTRAIRELQDRTGAGVLACKRALDEAGGDMEAAKTALLTVPTQESEGSRGDDHPPTLREIWRSSATGSAKTQADRFSGVYLVGHERVAMLPVEQAATMVSAAEFIKEQGRGIQEDRLAALVAFAGRLGEAMEVAKSSAVRLDVAPEEEGIAVFLLTQARARAALAGSSRIRHSCNTCGASTITNPDYERMLEHRRKVDALARSGGAALFSGGITPYLSTSLLLAFRKSHPDYSCRRCQALTTEPTVVVFCPQCRALHDKAVLKQCPKCGYDFVRGLAVSDIWHELGEITVPAPAGHKLCEVELDDEPTFLAFDDSGHMLSASQARSVQLWDIGDIDRPPECLWRVSAGGVVKISKPVVALSGDGRWVATGKPASRSFRLLNAANGTDAGRVDWAQADGWGPNGLAFSPDSRAVAVSYDNIDLWTISGSGLGNRIERIKVGFFTTFESLAFSPDGAYLAAAGGKLSFNRLFVWRTADWTQVGNFPAGGAIAALAWDPSAGQLAVAAGPVAVLIGVPAGNRIGEFRLEATVTGIAFSPDGSLLATASQDQTARVYDVREGSELARISRPSAVTAVAFACDGRLAIGDSTKMVQFWTPPSRS